MLPNFCKPGENMNIPILTRCLTESQGSLAHVNSLKKTVVNVVVTLSLYFYTGVLYLVSVAASAHMLDHGGNSGALSLFIRNKRPHLVLVSNLVF